MKRSVLWLLVSVHSPPYEYCVSQLGNARLALMLHVQVLTYTSKQNKDKNITTPRHSSHVTQVREEEARGAENISELSQQLKEVTGQVV